ncbi:FecR family protein [uncultured Aquimarina sp.]|uniref:FecR family protein n=1 Tax=uncultured Aquimarina sp. TaxID=575652 RepID=UPI00260E6D46|nr:FecR family protein [uncultured Aquimarina sp.]
MKKKDLIKKWLSNEQLTKHESEAFEKLNAYDSYIKISEAAKSFSAPDYNISSNQEILEKKLLERKGNIQKNSYQKIFLRIAAVFVLGLGLYFSFFKEYDTTINTIASEKATHELPDKSIIKLNALSSITYDKKNWDDERKLSLEGEAFFNVAKGNKFDVYTPAGVVSVIGTQFNIKQRGDIFEVICYEGVVSVTIANQVKYLKAGNALELVSEQIKEKKIIDKEPNWYSNKSYFQETPFVRVLKELEWQYGVTVKTKNIDPSILFTGNFVHSDIQTALKSITIPMRLKYVINNKTVTLYKE